MSMLAAVGRLGEIPGRLAPLRSIADFVLMDMPPSRSPGFTELLSGADDVIVPTQLERLSLEGVVLMAQTARALDAGPRLLGIVPNMARRQTNEHQAQMGSLVETFGKAVWPPVPLSVRVTEAASFGTTLFDLCPEHATTQAMRLLVDRLLENGGDA
jgi:chromosome partitioning protein